MSEKENKPYYSAAEICPILEMKYSSVIHLLRKNNIPKVDNKYMVTEEQLEQLKNRENQTLKSDMINDYLYYHKKGI